ncbi:DNA recombination protein RecO [Psychrobacter frigidicola]|uniref:DNA repair protein RecO n=1 Tax=Psychrobacter frigidicola TaxID=45611 RepID=A0A5C7A3E5_9GAMM|nr:DNA repair protein RecO C-terminal domain-containing protein [Psychrobacter frigidicola]TXD97112.1 DNA recombination protein RecO [Psychrobacter frigidicola]
MRNEALTGYLLHQRSYQEKRALYYLFSEQHGVIHGIGKKGAPLFEPLQLFATGKRDLKTFSQINIAPLDRDSLSSEPLRYEQIIGQQQYAALYLNEILWKLLPTEDPMPVLWQHYQDSLLQLKQTLTALELRLCLRQFEQHLFEQLGFAISLVQDSSLNDIDADSTYRFLPDVGLVPIIPADGIVNAQAQAVISGSEIVAMAELGITEATLNAWSRLYRHLIDHLLDYQPLQSRLLWQQQQRYQS